MKKSKGQFDEMIRHIKKSTNSVHLCQDHHVIKSNHQNLNNLICLANQFYMVIDIPSTKVEVISSNFKNIFGWRENQITRLDIENLIHPNDVTMVFKVSEEVVKIIYGNLELMQPFYSVFSIDFRMKSISNKYYRLLAQCCLYSKNVASETFQLLILFTDITQIKLNDRIEFDYTNHGDKVVVVFPTPHWNDLSNMFTHRELEIITLLSKGKNSKEIGKLLRISHHTVDTQRRNMLAKSKLKNTAELVSFCLENKILG